MVETLEDYVKECERDQRIKVYWITTKEQRAEIMTKPLNFVDHKKFRDKILNNDSLKLTKYDEQ